MPTPIGEAIIHVDAGEPALGPDGRVSVGTGAINHVSLTAVGWDEFRRRLESHVPWRENVVVDTTNSQMFAYNPSGVLLELSVDGRAENQPTPQIAPERLYPAGQVILPSPSRARNRRMIGGEF